MKWYVALQLRKYQDLKQDMSNKDFRILQGVLSTNFGKAHLTFTEERKKKQAEKERLKSRIKMQAMFKSQINKMGSSFVPSPTSSPAKKPLEIKKFAT